MFPQRLDSPLAYDIAKAMLDGGEEPRFLFRRMMIFASEDIGNADPWLPFPCC